jgi:hypothetical protein
MAFNVLRRGPPLLAAAYVKLAFVPKASKYVFASGTGVV